jgi:type I restriction enzyme, R subunit
LQNRKPISRYPALSVYYENRIPEIQLTNEALNDDLNKLIDNAMLDPDQEKKLERDFSKLYQIVTRDDRLEKIAIDIVDHFMNRGFKGKAMVVAIDKATAVKMYDKVKHQWQVKLDLTKKQIPTTTGDSLDLLKEKIAFMENTDMAVVVSQAQNEIEDLKKKGADILPHRTRMVKEDLATKFKDPDDPFRIVFVCAMWMTGFDVPSCSTIYLDKPMKNHTLMQTIARANRVFKEKTNGMIVDYVGVFRDLEKALAIYAVPKAGKPDVPIKNKAELLDQVVQSVNDTREYLTGLGIDIEQIRLTKDVFERTKLKNDAVDIIVADDTRKKRYLHLAEAVNKLYKAYLPDPVEADLAETAYLIRKIASTIRSLGEPVDVSDVMAKVEALLDESVKGFLIRDLPDEVRIHDLSKIDFEALQEKFKKGRKRTELERLRKSIEKKLEELVKANRTRIDFKEKYEEMIAEYLSGARSLEEIFKKLVDFSQALKDEEKRYIREELGSEEELAVFDLLTKPDMKLSKAEEREVKRIARELLDTLKREKLVLDWKKKQQTRAAVKVAIADTLDHLPDVYDKDLYSKKCDLVYQYVYDFEKAVPPGMLASFEIAQSKGCSDVTL